MPVLITALVPGQTQEGYDAAMLTLRPLLERAKGFIAHGAGMSPEGWRVFEIWETQQQATEFFAKYIHPNLPAGVTPKRTYVELYNLMLPPKGERARFVGTRTRETFPAAQPNLFVLANRTTANRVVVSLPA